jgi:ubiquinone/menaquinone biosynthesis C-methylase UbiE
MSMSVNDFAEPCTLGAMLARVLEPEIMDSAEEARDYDAMDHADVNAGFCADLLACGPLSGRVLDVGTGTALIPIELCRQAPVEVLAIDLADHMLALARENVARAALEGRIVLARVDAKSLPYAEGSFGVTLSNSIVHHIPEPHRVLAEMWRVTADGGRLFVRDLLRPENDAAVERLVERHGGQRPAADQVPAWERQHALFAASLRASLTLDEVRAAVAPLGVPPGDVHATSDRHWTLSTVKP